METLALESDVVLSIFPSVELDVPLEGVDRQDARDVPVATSLDFRLGKRLGFSTVNEDPEAWVRSQNKDSFPIQSGSVEEHLFLEQILVAGKLVPREAVDQVL